MKQFAIAISLMLAITLPSFSQQQHPIVEKDYVAYLFTYFTGNHISEEYDASFPSGHETVSCNLPSGPLTVTFCAVSGKATAIHKKANPFSLFLMIK